MALSKIPDRRAVKSDEGFTVERLGSPMTQFLIRYSEDNHWIEYPLENLTPDSQITIFASQITSWLPPFSEKILSAEKRVQIAERMADGMTFMGDAVTVRP